MKRYVYFPVVVVFAIAVTLISWGVVGHSTVARIAENHLTPQAKAGVLALLGSESLVDVSSWADQVRNDPEYRSTASWHYINTPLGLNFTEFSNDVVGQNSVNVYKAILKCKEDLLSKTTTREQKAVALKFLVHFVGDIHQPMHVSRAEDKGGNTIQLQFDGKGTNLHSLWDSRLIDHEGLTYAELAKTDDNATPAQIKKWQTDSPLTWAFESYQASSKLYAEIEGNNRLDEQYYKDHISIVGERIERGGIRLAGLLNEIFNENPMLPTHDVYRPKPVADQAMTVSLDDLGNHYGQMVTVNGKVSSTKSLPNMVLVNIGGEYPNQLLTVVLKGGAMALAGTMDQKMVSVSGTAVQYKGKPEIVVTDTKQVQTMP